MSRLLKSRDYLKKCLLFVLLFGFISLGTIGGCSNDNGGQGDTQALTENDFANDPALRDNPEEGIVVDFLEPPLSQAPENDTGEVGIDEIPVRYPQTVEQTFCWEDDDTQAMHFMELIDSEGIEILRVDVNGECVTEIIESGNYVMSIHHDGMTDTTLPIFIIPNPDDIQQAKETDGFIKRFNIAVAYILEGIQNTITKDTRAQTIKDNIFTLITTKKCPGCDLSFANLVRANLVGANLVRAELFRTKLIGAKLIGANLMGARLFRATLIEADLSEADLSEAILAGANLNGADLTEADLTRAKLNRADLTLASLFEADLTRARLNGAKWCDGMCICADTSIGTCVGCAPQNTCTGP